MKTVLKPMSLCVAALLTACVGGTENASTSPIEAAPPTSPPAPAPSQPAPQQAAPGDPPPPAAPSPSPSPEVRTIGQTSDGQAEVSCDDLLKTKPVVFLAYGQSIASNFNEVAYQPHNAVYSIEAGRCYQSRDPMRGAEGSKGSMWSRLGDEITPADFKRTAFVTIGVGGASITRWDVGGDLNSRLTDAVDALHGLGFDLNYILWHQGSADRGMSKADYTAHFKGMIGSLNTHGVQIGLDKTQTRALVAVHTLCNSASDPEIEAAQRGLVNQPAGYFAGADTDTIGSDQRFDGCHLSEAGLKTAAQLWTTQVRAAAGYTAAQ